MIKKKIEKMLVDQVNFEIYSAYIYLGMAAYCDDKDYPGFANWLKIQWEEEIFHAMKMYNYIIERGGKIALNAIPAPPKTWKSVITVFEHALEHEQLVTTRINKMMTAAIKEDDHATRSFLNWFVDEQVEEEANVDGIIKRLKMVKDSGHGLFMFDKELAARTFVPPVKGE